MSDLSEWYWVYVPGFNCGLQPVAVFRNHVYADGYLRRLCTGGEVHKGGMPQAEVLLTKPAQEEQAPIEYTPEHIGTEWK